MNELEGISLEEALTQFTPATRANGVIAWFRANRNTFLDAIWAGRSYMDPSAFDALLDAAQTLGQPRRIAPTPEEVLDAGYGSE